MRHNTAKKIPQSTAAHAQTPAEIFDFPALTRLQIAVQAENASHLSGNTETADFEAFLTPYGNGIASDFA